MFSLSATRLTRKRRKAFSLVDREKSSVWRGFALERIGDAPRNTELKLDTRNKIFRIYGGSKLASRFSVRRCAEQIYLSRLMSPFKRNEKD